MKRKPHAVLGVVLAVLAVALLAPPTSASQRAADGSDAGAPYPGSDVKFKAGYTATTSPSELTTASATIVLPELTCPKDWQGISLGIGSEPVFGKFKYLAVVHTTCKGDPEYKLNAHVRGHRHARQAFAFPGNTVRVTVKLAESGVVTAIVKNLTKPSIVRQRGTPRHDNVIDFGAFPLFLYGDMVEVPEFQPVSITHATVGTDSGSVCIGETDPVTNVREDRYTNEVEIAPGPLNGCDFSLVFKSH